MTTKELLYVKTVADEKNISKAAKKLFIAQPSLSQSIQRIEESVGTELFNRTSGGLTMTFAGERYYHMAVQVLKLYQDFEMEISDINNLKTGRIHLGTTNHLGTLVLPKVLPRFHELCANIALNISEENTTILEQLLLSGELDFALMHAPSDPAQHPQFHYDIMKRDPFVLAIAPDHPLTALAEIREGYPYPVLDIRLAAKEPFLMLHTSQRIRQITDNVLRRAGITRPRISMTLRNFETTQLLAAKGMGLALIPLEYSRISPSDFQPSLLCIDKKYHAYWDTCIATLKDGFLSKADQLFIRIAKEELA